jgi:hypothetical protein
MLKVANSEWTRTLRPISFHVEILFPTQVCVQRETILAAASTNRYQTRMDSREAFVAAFGRKPDFFCSLKIAALCRDAATPLETCNLQLETL